MPTSRPMKKQGSASKFRKLYGRKVHQQRKKAGTVKLNCRGIDLQQQQQQQRLIPLGGVGYMDQLPP